MKTKLHSLFILAFYVLITNAFAQIPDSDFENWGTYIDSCAPIKIYANPPGWTGSVSTDCADVGYSIQKVNENYPEGTGQYSISISSDITLGYKGIALTSNTHNKSLIPSFPIEGHPNSLTGYYKYEPDNGDSMRIFIQLFQNGEIVSEGTYSSADIVSDWTSFDIPLSVYTSADSGVLVLAAYNAIGPPPQYVPHGNSVLNIDNLRFDSLVPTGVSAIGKRNAISVYPNPNNGNFVIQTSVNEKQTMKVFDITGKLMFTQFIISGKTNIDASALAQGIYNVSISSDQSIENQRLVIVK